MNIKKNTSNHFLRHIYNTTPPYLLLILSIPIEYIPPIKRPSRFFHIKKSLNFAIYKKKWWLTEDLLVGDVDRPNKGDNAPHRLKCTRAVKVSQGKMAFVFVVSKMCSFSSSAKGKDHCMNEHLNTSNDTMHLKQCILWKSILWK